MDYRGVSKARPPVAAESGAEAACGTPRLSSRPMRARHLQLLAGITLAGALLRFATLDVQSYWLDEVSIDNNPRHLFGGMPWAVPAGECAPPPCYVLAWLWSKAFGTGEVGLRSLSALLGT